MVLNDAYGNAQNPLNFCAGHIEDLEGKAYAFVEIEMPNLLLAEYSKER